MPRAAAKVNANGHRIGDSHHNAVLTDHEVELIRQLADSGMTQQAIASKFGVTKSQICKIVNFKARAQTPV